MLTVDGMIRLLGPNTNVRVRNFSNNAHISGNTSRRGELMQELNAKNTANSYVTKVYALFHAQEVYIECG